MAKTPSFNRKHVVLLGRTNAGKSTLLNTLAGRQAAIVASTPGTTTDAVSVPMELHPFGPVVLVDTAGFADTTPLGEKRAQSTNAALRKADAVIYMADGGQEFGLEYQAFTEKEYPHILVITKTEQLPQETQSQLAARYPQAVFTAPKEEGWLNKLRIRLAQILQQQTAVPKPLLADFIPPGSTVLMVVQMDEGAPEGRLILPQVQLLRHCIDSGIACYVVQIDQLEKALKNVKKIDLVVTDSQLFKKLEKCLPASLPLTSFSILLARQKADFSQLYKGAKTLDKLSREAKILVLEGCTHNATHADIGRVRLPQMLMQKTGLSLRFEHRTGHDFPENLESYTLAIQCGSCMLSSKEIEYRLAACRKAGLPITNYGMALAWGSGILNRCCEPFMGEGNHRKEELL